MTTWLAQEFVRSQKLENNKAPMAQDPLEQVAIVGKHPHQVSLESWQLFNVFFSIYFECTITWSSFKCYICIP